MLLSSLLLLVLFLLSLLLRLLLLLPLAFFHLCLAYWLGSLGCVAVGRVALAGSAILGAPVVRMQESCCCAVVVLLVVSPPAPGFLVGFPGASLSVGSPWLARQSSVPRWFACKGPAVAMSAFDARRRPRP